MIEEVTSLANQTQYYVTKSWHSSHSNGKREAEVGRGAIFAQHFQWLQQRMFARRPPSVSPCGVQVLLPLLGLLHGSLLGLLSLLPPRLRPTLQAGRRRAEFVREEEEGEDEEAEECHDEEGNFKKVRNAL